QRVLIEGAKLQLRLAARKLFDPCDGKTLLRLDDRRQLPFRAWLLGKIHDELIVARNPIRAKQPALDILSTVIRPYDDELRPAKPRNNRLMLIPCRIAVDQNLIHRPPSRKSHRPLLKLKPGAPNRKF